MAGAKGTRRLWGLVWVGAGCQEDPAGLCGAPKPAGSPELSLRLPVEWAAVFALAEARAGGPSPPSVSLEGLAGTLGSTQIRGQGSSLGLRPPTEAVAPQPLGPAGPGRLTFVWAAQD